MNNKNKVFNGSKLKYWLIYLNYLEFFFDYGLVCGFFFVYIFYFFYEIRNV